MDTNNLALISGLVNSVYSFEDKGTIILGILLGNILLTLERKEPITGLPDLAESQWKQEKGATSL